MALLVGAVLAFSVGLLMTFIGLDRDRAFYPTVMIIIASYYALFAVMGASTQVQRTQEDNRNDEVDLCRFACYKPRCLNAVL